MSGLKLLVLGCLVAALPVATQAEIIAMDDATLGDVTAQSGLSIELAATITIGEIAYKDEGFLVVSDLRLAGSDLGINPNSRLDNILLTIDVAGANPTDLRNNLSCCESVTTVHFSDPFRCSPCHFLATNISIAQTPSVVQSMPAVCRA